MSARRLVLLACLASGAAIADSSVGDQHGDQRPGVCPSARPPGALNSRAGGCKSDQDCKAGPNGRCVASYGRREFANYCSYDQCSTDGDCKKVGPKLLCMCRSPEGEGANVCMPGNCHTDADCAGGRRCTSSRSNCRRIDGFWCRTPNDACKQDSDCGGAGGGGKVCAFEPLHGRWTCVEIMCPPG